MPRIKPFYALRPAYHLQKQVVSRPLESYSLGQARLMASENPYTFLHLVNPELDHPYLRGSRQELIYKKINENFENFVENEVLIKEQTPCLYIYQVEQDQCKQTGLWTLTHVDAYFKGEIKKHELTVERREKLLSDYLQQTGIDANPVLITYFPDKEINQLIATYLQTQPDTDFIFEDGSAHRLWAIRSAAHINFIVQAFAAMPEVYIADGHHRMASMAKMASQKRSLNPTNAEGSFNYFSAAYFSTEQVKILPFNRLVKDLGQFTPAQFIDELHRLFVIEKAAKAVEPDKMHQFGMYLDHCWYRLTAKPSVCPASNPVTVLDVSILQNEVLEPLLKISDPRTDARITFEGGKTTLDELQFKVDSGHYAVAFILFPTTIQQLIDVADAGGVMPPKSTWIEPKFLIGLLTHYFG